MVLEQGAHNLDININAVCRRQNHALPWFLSVSHAPMRVFTHRNEMSNAWRHRENDAGITACLNTKPGPENVNATISVISNMVSICFYTPTSYEELKVVADDKKVLCDTYANWLAEFSKAVNGLRKEGINVVPITINIEKLVQWCKQNKLKNTSANRSKYVAELSRVGFED